MNQDDVIGRYGRTIELGPCLVGRVLNLTVLRGFAPLDVLAVVSAPDIYDQVSNPHGTQRDLKPTHASEAFTYAMDALNAAEARYFPELLLNVRDIASVELYNLDDPNDLLALDSQTDPGELGGLSTVGVRVVVDQLQFPKRQVSPQISRVDGNHRLHRADEMVAQLLAQGENSPEVFPNVAFACFIDLPRETEAKLFKDINHEQAGMETAHLVNIELRITSPEQLRDDPRLRPLYLASELAQDGRAFESMVFWGGSTKSLKAEGFVPPVKINSLRSTIHQQLRTAGQAAIQLEDNPQAMLNLLDNFWKAVRRVFPEAWDNKKDFILLQAVGLGGFAKFGGHVIDRAYEEKRVSVEDFENVLAPVAKRVDLAKSEWPGVAGAAGQEVVYRKLMEASTPEAVHKEEVVAVLTTKQSLADALAAKEGDSRGSA